MTIFLIDDVAQVGGSDCVQAFLADDIVGSHSFVAVDCEGVCLGRHGTLEIVSIALRLRNKDSSLKETKVFVVDIGKGRNETLRGKLILALKRLLEDQNVVKVMHDCKKDSDALYHHCGIKLNAVHDTSAFHKVITNERDNKGLNHVLTYNGIDEHSKHNNTVYKFNPCFWARRPLTKSMIDRAAGDVDKLLDVAEKQLADLSTTRGTKQLVDLAYEMSKKNANELRSMHQASGLQCKVPIGRFIGARGSSIKSLQRRTGTLIYEDKRNNTWIVYYRSSNSLHQVKEALGY